MHTSSTRKALWLFAWTLASATPAAMAQELIDADTLEVYAYRFSAAGLEKFSQATDNLIPILAEHPAGCDEGDDVDSLDAMAARIEAVPGAAAAIGSAGMNAREYAVFSVALIQSALGAWVLNEGGELPEGFSIENVHFFQEHEMELKEIVEQLEFADCSARGDDDEEADPAWDDDESWDESDG